jgi:YD repeat-containing protein
LLLGAPALAANIQYVYDELGRLIAEIDPAGDVTRYTYDPAGNLLSVTRDSSTAFRVDGFSPSSGRAGDSITIFGAGFITNPAQNTVSFNGAPATVTLATAHSLVATVPASATTGPITVSNANGTAATAQAFTVIAVAGITGVSPGNISRGQTTRIEISGTNLDSATAVTFSEPGFSAQLVAREPTRLTIDLTVGAVPFGSYAFSVTNFAGTSQSGAVVVTVTAALTGPAMTVSRSLSVHVPALIPGAPAGNAVSASRRPVSVHVPALIPGAPAGNAMSAGARPISVHVPAANPGAPAGNALEVAKPVSTLRP